MARKLCSVMCPDGQKSSSLLAGLSVFAFNYAALVFLRGTTDGCSCEMLKATIKKTKTKQKLDAKLFG